MSEFRSAITQGADGRWIVTTGNLETVYAPTDRAAAVQIATLQQRILELEEERERLRSTLHRVTQTCAEQHQLLRKSEVTATESVEKDPGRPE